MKKIKMTEVAIFIFYIYDFTLLAAMLSHLRQSNELWEEVEMKAS